MKQKHRIVYMGTPTYAEEILRTLIEADDMDVVLVVTQPDRPVGRKKILTPPPVKVLAGQHDIAVVQPNRLSDEGVTERIVSAAPDFIVVAAFGQLLPPQTLRIAPCINLHASLLPRYRGASPIQHALLNGDTLTGVTSMLMDEGLDTGAILLKRERPIDPEIGLKALTAQLTEDACALTLETLRRFETIEPVPQNEAEATHCKKIRKSDGEVDGSDAVALYNRYRAFEGWPGVFVANGTKLDAITLVARTGTHKPFEILAIEADAVEVGCQRGAVRIGTLQPPSKKPMSARAYCVGRGLRVGDRLV
jgi:methionyl-tRNA formyltransferase